MTLYFEDVPLGRTIHAPQTYVPTAEEIIAFAEQWDPQPFHTDPVAAAASVFGGLTASSLHSEAIVLKLISTMPERFGDALIGVVEAGNFRLPRPVRPGDRLRLSFTYLSKRRSRSNPGRGVVTIAIEMRNGADEVVLARDDTLIIRCRSEIPPPGETRACLAAAMPMLLAHEGVWEGSYRHLDATGETIDRHDARIVCAFPEDGADAYVQTSAFAWPDGRQQRHVVSGRLGDKRLEFDTEQLAGVAWEGPAESRSVFLSFRYKNDPEIEIMETIVLGASGEDRARTWHWLRAGRLWQRTIIHEQRVARTAQHVDADMRS